MGPWFRFWLSFWQWPEPSSTCKPQCNLDDLTEALTTYLDSAREVAAGAAKNVEDAEKLLKALRALAERKKRAAECN
jgi:hypothetical protein